jgi:hypothetical protein
MGMGMPSTWGMQERRAVARHGHYRSLFVLALFRSSGARQMSAIQLGNYLKYATHAESKDRQNSLAYLP